MEGTLPAGGLGWKRVPASADIPAYFIFSGDINKPELDDREYRLICLENGILTVLVQDSGADKAAASLTVATGHLQDPDDIPGLAHFCEHMIKKGSDPYPAENDFLSYIITHGGVQNAGTSAAWQDYWFSINPSNLSGALPRLAAFFHSPLFLANLTAREMNAVDSENKRNLQNDSRRLLQLEKSLSQPDHPWTKFGTGNLETLTEAAKRKLDEDGQPTDIEDGDGGPVGRAVRERLVNWWKQEYCAGRMTLSVLGKESLDDLVKLTVPFFSLIPNRKLDPRPRFTDPVWGPEQKGTVLFVKTIKDYHELKIVFHIPDQTTLYRTRPSSFLAHFLGHEGPGSVFALLKKRGWLLDISASTSSGNRSVHTFTVAGSLTREGYLHYKEVVVEIFHYLSLLRDSPFEPYHFDEIRRMSEFHFRFREKGQPHAYVRRLSLDLLDLVEPPELLSAGATTREWDEEAVRRLLDTLRPENARITVTARDHDSAVVGDNNIWATEKWYGTQYQVQRLSSAFLEEASRPNENIELFLPKPNPYVPKNLSVNDSVVEVHNAPRIIHETPLSRLWFKADDHFGVPKAQVRILIKSPVAYSTPRAAVLTRLFVDLVEDSLSEITYDAQLAGLHYSIGSGSLGLNVVVSGYDDKLPLLLDVVLSRLRNVQLEQDRLKVKSEELERSYKNYYLGQPSSLSEDYTSFFLSVPSWTPAEKLVELSYVSLADLKWHKEELLRKIHVETLITGNVIEEKAVSISRDIESRLMALPLPVSEWPRDRSLLLPPGSNYIVNKKHSNSEEKNSALTYYCQFGETADTLKRAALRLIAHIIKEPAFSQLRTVEQLGYVVTTPLWIQAGAIGISFRIQSLKSPSFLEERVEAFIRTFRETLVSTTQGVFGEWKEALAVKLLEQPKNLGEETSRFWSQIQLGSHDFLRDATDAAIIRELAYDQVLSIYDEYMVPNDRSRRFSLHLLSHKLSESVEEQPPISKGTLVEDEVLLRAAMTTSGAAVPIMGPTVLNRRQSNL
ncbi:LuxS/MPP-like metallohydrolase [Trametopsis cervina]|nr:LuxS/MPP-like metallohydrolase [Trametopsis cervina]